MCELNVNSRIYFHCVSYMCRLIILKFIQTFERKLSRYSYHHQHYDDDCHSVIIIFLLSRLFYSWHCISPEWMTITLFMVVGDGGGGENSFWIFCDFAIMLDNNQRIHQTGRIFFCFVFFHILLMFDIQTCDDDDRST